MNTLTASGWVVRFMNECLEAYNAVPRTLFVDEEFMASIRYEMGLIDPEIPRITVRGAITSRVLSIDEWRYVPRNQEAA